MLPDAQLIKAIDLAAASRRQARYYLSLYELPGYVISKLSGPVGQEKAAEEWYRPTLSMAEKKYSVKTRIVVPPTLSGTEGSPCDESLFDRCVVVRTRKALRLKRDLELNLNSVALIMELLDKIDELDRHAE